MTTFLGVASAILYAPRFESLRLHYKHKRKQCSSLVASSSPRDQRTTLQDKVLHVCFALENTPLASWHVQSLQAFRHLARDKGRGCELVEASHGVCAANRTDCTPFLTPICLVGCVHVALKSKISCK
jgi:hypothetical protein